MSEIPYLSREDIETKAEEIIEYFDSKLLKKPSFTPLVEFISKTKERTKLAFDINSDLGYSVNEKKILGMFTFEPRAIFIDKSLINDIRFNFTLGHEFGHFVFHRNLNITKINYNVLEDTETDLVTGERRFKTDRHWIEWQASFFSAAILMPRFSIRKKLIDIQRELDISRNLGTIYVDKSIESIRLFDKVISEFAKYYRVSKSNAEYRLKSLSMVVDHRLKDVKHISELLSEK